MTDSRSDDHRDKNSDKSAKDAKIAEIVSTEGTTNSEPTDPRELTTEPITENITELTEEPSTYSASATETTEPNLVDLAASWSALTLSERRAHFASIPRTE